VVPLELMQSTDFFDELSEEMLKRLAEIAELKSYPAGVFLNEGKRIAKYFFIILEGDISLQMESLTGKTVRLETITPGGAIGFSALIEMEPKRYIGDAKILTPVKALRFPADAMMLLFYQDFELGFLIMKKIALIAKRRLMYRTFPIPKI
jgi:CRP/FNR family transcriptional regulator, cyclic AMP receptor protein